MIAMQRVRKTKDPESIQESWISGEVKAYWSVNIRVIKDWLRDIEWRSVAVGLRSCGLCTVPHSGLPAFSQTIARFGLTVVPLAQIASGGYRSNLTAPKEGEACAVFCVVAPPKYIAEFTNAWQANSHKTIGQLLGYPNCCIGFFERVWPSHADTTWPMACNTEGGIEIPAQNTIGVQALWQTNVLLRWIGVRVVPHLPCSFQCRETTRFADSLLKVDPSKGASVFLQEMLSWPIEWRSTCGTAEIRTPFVTISTTTDYADETYIVRAKAE